MPIAHLQTATVTTVGPLAYSSNVKIGSLLVVWATWGSTAQTASVSDSLGNIWTNIFQRTETADIQSCGAWFAISRSAGADTVTFSLPTSAFPDLGVSEYSGTAQTNPLDTSAATAAGGVSASTTPATGSVIPSVGGELVWSYLNKTANQAVTSPPTNFTQRAVTATNATADWIQNINSTVNPTWTTASGNYNGITAVFKTASPTLSENYKSFKSSGLSVTERIR